MFDLHFFHSLESRRILVVGDVMLDKFYLAKMAKFSSDAPIPVAKINDRYASPGGAANVARCLANLGAKPILTGFVGCDHNYETFMKYSGRFDINHSGLFITDHLTHTKVRIISQNQQVFRLDFDDDKPYNDALFDRLFNFIHHNLNKTLDAVVIADYEKGVCTEQFCQNVIRDAAAHGTPTLVLPYGSNWIKYAHADFIVPNTNKINRVLLSPVDPSNDQQNLAAAHYIRRKFSIKTTLLTRSAFGITLASDSYEQHFPTKQQLLVDPAGAADAVIAATTAAVANGKSPVIAANLSNLVAGIAVSQPGSYAPTFQEIIDAA